MSRRLFAVPLALLGVALLAQRCAAQEIPKGGVYTVESTRGATPTKPAYPSADIAAESPRGVTLRSAKMEIPEETIQEIVFEIRPVEVNSIYRSGIIAERQARASPKDREKERAKALAKYEEALAALVKAKAAEQSFARAHLQYKIAALLYEQGTEEGKAEARQQAAEKLAAFKTQHKQAWQLARALRMLAQLQLAEQKYAAAEQTYRELAGAGVAPAVAQDATLQALLVALQAGNSVQAEARKLLAGGERDEALKKLAAAEKQFQEVQGKLEKLISGPDMPKDSPPQLRARLALAECLATSGAAKKVAAAKGDAAGPLLARARKEVEDVLKVTKDDALRGTGHNVLGYCYYLDEKWQDARWEFLWVDVKYNKSPQEHAKALYYLADIFARLGEPELARGCREMLRGQQFSGTDYQLRLLQESKS
jgi:hypothetical protein